MRTTFAGIPDYTAEFIGLAMTCPIELANPPDCPFHEIRKMSVLERFQWLRNHTRLQAENLLCYHANCCPRTLTQLTATGITTATDCRQQALPQLGLAR